MHYFENSIFIIEEVMEDYDPIVFQNGEFKVRKIGYASLPALRVTAYGASAYARYYNRRLPTFTEWLHALGDGSLQLEGILADGGESPEKSNMQAMHSQMNTEAKADVSGPKSSGSKLSSVINEQPNKYGIRGLNKNTKEWGLKVSDATSRDNIREAEYVVLPSTLQRYPWEGFAEVGFRCVREVKITVQ